MEENMEAMNFFLLFIIDFLIFFFVISLGFGFFWVYISIKKSYSKKTLQIVSKFTMYWAIFLLLIGGTGVIQVLLGFRHFEMVNAHLPSILIFFFLILSLIGLNLIYLLIKNPTIILGTRLIIKAKFENTAKEIKSYLNRHDFISTSLNKHENTIVYRRGSLWKGFAVFEVQIEGVENTTICECKFYFKPGFPFHMLEFPIESKFQFPDMIGRKKAFILKNDFISFLREHLDENIKVQERGRVSNKTPRGVEPP
ncbi:MAG: hypothetical protein KKD98_06400 [Candidatus Thermoplasmatota archaeon]|nr:hypothetical protein [Candidatus Thermoplasmatota archaeon]